MSHPKKNFNPWRCAIINIVLGIFMLLCPFILLKSFSYALLYLLLISTISTINVLNVNRKSLLVTFPTPFSTAEDTKGDRLRQKSEKKEFSLFVAVLFLTVSILMYYGVSVIFGVSVFESMAATLYFSTLMTILTVYPLVWYLFYSDSLMSVLKLLADIKCDPITDGHLTTLLLWTVLGSWVGAFPIPLDWDRPWQTWPMTCCIGASVGNSIGQFIVGFRLIFQYFRDRRKVLLNRSA